MKLRSYLIIIVVLVFGVTGLTAQNPQGRSQQSSVRGPAGMPVNQSSRLEVLNQGKLFFDINLNNKTSVLYMGNSPIFTFNVRVVKYNRRGPRNRGQEYVLRGNTEQRVIIDEGQGVVFLKIKKRNGGVKKLIISRISIQQMPNRRIRYNLNDNVNLAINLNHNNGFLSSTVAFKGVPIFVMQTGYDVYQGRRNNNILQFKGNSAGVLYYNRTNQTFYYKKKNKRGTWSKVRRIRR